MFQWSKVDRQRRRITRDDQRFLEARVRRFLSGYLTASELEKELYYEAVAGASSGCQPANSMATSRMMARSKIDVTGNCSES